MSKVKTRQGNKKSQAERNNKSQISKSNGTTTLGQLEPHLWEAANILRGPVDAADFKTYVFPLLFFKRISDVYDEEYESALAESGGDEEYAACFRKITVFRFPRTVTGVMCGLLRLTSAKHCKRPCAV